MKMVEQKGFFATSGTHFVEEVGKAEDKTIGSWIGNVCLNPIHHYKFQNWEKAFQKMLVPHIKIIVRPALFIVH